jgi:tripartite-type tricarboxylate transporter receptor subunit TctC
VAIAYSVKREAATKKEEKIMARLSDIFDPNVERLSILPRPANSLPSEGRGSVFGKPIDYKSWVAPQMLVDIAGNNVDYVFAPLISSVTMIREGKVVPLAVSSEKRAVAFPNIPTMAESGYPQGQFNFWIGMLAPAQTPKAILDKMNDEINAIVDMPDVRERFEKMGALPFKMKPAAFDKFIEEEAVALGEVMKASGAKLD